MRVLALERGRGTGFCEFAGSHLVSQEKPVDEGIAVFFSNMGHIWPPGAPPVAWMRCGLGPLGFASIRAGESSGKFWFTGSE